MDTEKESQCNVVNEQEEPSTTFTEIDPKTIWPDKAALTKWLSQNLQLLSDVLGRQLIPSRKPNSARKWGPDARPDLWLRDGKTNRGVMVLNQLEPLDPDHWGRFAFLYYSHLRDALISIWIGPAPAPELVDIISRQNAAMKRREPWFFMIRLQVCDKGDGTSIVRLSPWAGPSDWVWGKDQEVLVAKI